MFNKKLKNEKGPVNNINSREAEEQEEIQKTLAKIKNKYVVLSGKGGVGKSTVAVNLAVLLANKGYKTGLLDIDIHGPSVPKMLGIEDKQIAADSSGKLVPINYNDKLKVVSIAFVMQDKRDAVIWRGPLKYGVIKQFIKDVSWEELDYLIIDSPPGTGDEPLSVVQLIDGQKGAIIVTTPQEVAILDVMKSITFCKKLNIPVVGLIENMSGFKCPHCGEQIDIFKRGGGEKLAKDMEVPYLGSIPMEENITNRGDSGKPFVNYNSDEDTGAGNAFKNITKKIFKLQRR